VGKSDRDGKGGKGLGFEALSPGIRKRSYSIISYKFFELKDLGA